MYAGSLKTIDFNTEDEKEAVGEGGEGQAASHNPQAFTVMSRGAAAVACLTNMCSDRSQPLMPFNPASHPPPTLLAGVQQVPKWQRQGAACH